MNKNYKNLSYGELKVLVFEQNQATKQNKDRLFKLAKENGDIVTIEQLAYDLHMKSAMRYMEIFQKKTIEKNFGSVDLESIKNAVENGMDVNATNEKGSTFLHFAAEQDNRALIKFLIDNKADINKQDKDGATPLLLAAQENNYEAMKLLIDANAQMDLKSKHGYTPLLATVAKFNSVDAANLLINNGATIDVQDIRGVSPLMLGAQQNFKSIVAILIEKGANPNLTDKYGYNALHVPCELGHENIVKLLLQTKVNINHQDKDGDTPLIIASKNGFKNIVRMLINQGADLDLQNKDGDTALIRAAYGNHFEVVKLLVEKGANLNLTSKDNATALTFSMAKNNKEMTTYLIKSGANKILLQGEKLNPILLQVCQQGDVELVHLFLDNGADKNYKGENGNTPLMLASTNNHLDIVDILLKNHVDVNLQNDYLITPLWSASYHEHIDVVKLLLNEGADPNIKVGEDKMTALFSVARKRFNENDLSVSTMKQLNENDKTLSIARVLLQKGANPNIPNVYGSTLLNLSSRIGDLDMMTLLIDYKAQLDIQENTGLTPLMAAAHADQLEACQLLIDYGANVNKVSSNQQGTALSSAIENNNLEIVKLLVKEGADPNHVCMSTINATPFGVHPNDMRHGTPLELAKEYGFKEIEQFLNHHMQSSSAEEDFPKGSIVLEENLRIDVFKKYLSLQTKAGDELFETIYSKTDAEDNTYQNDTKGSIVIFKDHVVKKTKSNDLTEYKILKLQGSFLDIDSLEHDPITLSSYLKRFSNSDKLRYSNHIWGGSKKYNDFIENIKTDWNEIQEEIKVLSSDINGDSHLHNNISKFLFEEKLGEYDSQDQLISWGNQITIGWSSPKIVKGIKEGLLPETIEINDQTKEKFETVMEQFKRLFVIEPTGKTAIFENLGLKVKEWTKKLTVNIRDLKKKKNISKIFTDVERLEKALRIIIGQCEKHAGENTNIKITVSTAELKWAV